MSAQVVSTNKKSFAPAYLDFVRRVIKLAMQRGMRTVEDLVPQWARVAAIQQGLEQAPSSCDISKETFYALLAAYWKVEVADVLRKGEENGEEDEETGEEDGRAAQYWVERQLHLSEFERRFRL